MNPSWDRATKRAYARFQANLEVECGECGEIFKQWQLDEGVCPDCIKKRDLADSMERT